MDMDIDAIGGGNISNHAMEDVWSTLSLSLWNCTYLESGIVENLAAINLGTFDFDQACDEEAALEEPGSYL